MEFFDYLRHLYQYRWWLLASLLIGGLLGGSLAAVAPEKYQGTMSLYTKRQADPSNTQYFTYEGYYAQQTATNFTDTAIKMLSNDEIIRRAATLAGMDQDTESIQKLRSAMVSKKDAPQLIKLTVTMPTQAEVTSFSKGLAQALKDRTTELNQTGDSHLAVDTVNPEPFVVSAKLGWPLLAAAGAILGLILGTVATAVWSYVQTRRRPSKSK